MNRLIVTILYNAIPVALISGVVAYLEHKREGKDFTECWMHAAIGGIGAALLTVGFFWGINYLVNSETFGRTWMGIMILALPVAMTVAAYFAAKRAPHLKKGKSKTPPIEQEPTLPKATHSKSQRHR